MWNVPISAWSACISLETCTFHFEIRKTPGFHSNLGIGDWRLSRKDLKNACASHISSWNEHISWISVNCVIDRLLPDMVILWLLFVSAEQIAVLHTRHWSVANKFKSYPDQEIILNFETIESHVVIFFKTPYLGHSDLICIVHRFNSRKYVLYIELLLMYNNKHKGYPAPDFHFISISGSRTFDRATLRRGIWKTQRVALHNTL